MDFVDLAKQCAPDIAYTTLVQVVKAESNFNPLAISDDGLINLPFSKRKHTLRSFKPTSTADAIKTAKALIQSGHIVGIGLGQINHRNLSMLGYTVEQAFDSCNNLKMINKLLTANYAKSLAIYKNEKKALIASLSMYNTGNATSGVKNGYVNKVIGHNTTHIAFTQNQTVQYQNPATAKTKVQLNSMKVALN